MAATSDISPGDICASDISPDISFVDLARVVDQYAEPWETVAQCDLYLRAAAIYRRRMATEAEKDGLRLSKTDIEAAILECRKRRGALQFCASPDTVIVPPDRLR